MQFPGTRLNGVAISQAGTNVVGGNGGVVEMIGVGVGGSFSKGIFFLRIKKLNRLNWTYRIGIGL